MSTFRPHRKRNTSSLTLLLNSLIRQEGINLLEAETEFPRRLSNDHALTFQDRSRLHTIMGRSTLGLPRDVVSPFSDLLLFARSRHPDPNQLVGP